MKEKNIKQYLSQNTCLRCGYCCYHWAVNNVPNILDGYKGQFKNCPHLVPAKLIDGQWQVAECLLHDSPTFPYECQIFSIPGARQICAIGQHRWKERSFEGKLPDAVKKFLN